MTHPRQSWDKRQITALIDDLEWLFHAGESPQIIMHRVGYDNPDSLARRLARWGQTDLARTFWLLGYYSRKESK